MMFCRFSYDFAMVSLWFSSGFPMVVLWFPSGFTIVSHGFLYVFVWFCIVQKLKIEKTPKQRLRAPKLRLRAVKQRLRKRVKLRTGGVGGRGVACGLRNSVCWHQSSTREFQHGACLVQVGHGAEHGQQ